MRGASKMRNLILVIGSSILMIQSALAQNNQCTSEGKKIISLGGAVTEMIYALGEQDRLVGVDVTSTYPMDALKLPKVGYYRAVSAEGLLSLGPDLIIADPDAGPPEVLNQLAAVGVCINKVGDGGSAEAVLNRVTQISEALGVSEKGEQFKAALKTKFDMAMAGHDNVEMEKPRVLFLLSAKDGTPVAAGDKTDAASIIKLSGAENAVGGFEGYKPLSSEVAAASGADYILMMDHVVKSSGGKESILNLPQIKMTPAGQNGKLIAMDGLLLLGFGPRTPDALEQLSSQFNQ